MDRMNEAGDTMDDGGYPLAWEDAYPERAQAQAEQFIQAMRRRERDAWLDGLPFAQAVDEMRAAQRRDEGVQS